MPAPPPVYERTVGPTGHSDQCSYHCDQYPWECDCGLYRPATVSWAERELSAAMDRLDNAEEDVRFAKARLRSMRE